MSVVSNNLLLAAEDDSGYVIDRSLRFRSSAPAYLNRTPASAGNRRTWTWSGWVKRGTLNTTQCLFGNINLSGVNEQFYFGFSFANRLDLFHFENGAFYQLTSAAVYRDTSAWYHFLVAVDTTAATASNRFKLYVNGVELNSFVTSSYPPQNTNTFINTTLNTGIGVQLGTGGGTAYYFDGYMTEVNFIDGQALTPSSFGETNALTGVWQPKAYEGTYGTNGFYLNFSDPTSTTTLTADQSGNGNNWTANNISLTSGSTYDSMIDRPTPVADVRGNFAVLNPLNKDSQPTITNGNLTVSMGVAGGGWRTVPNTIAMPTGKWYAEVTFSTVANSGSAGVGIAAVTTNFAGLVYPGLTATSYGYINNGNKVNNDVSTAYGATWTTGDVIGIAFDATAGTLTFYKNNVSQGTAFLSISAALEYYFIVGGANVTNTCDINFGQRPFAYTPPSGFKALHTGNLPEPAIVDGGEYFNPVLYSGNNGTQSITGVGFAPDWVWIKVRNEVNSHYLFDQLRGADQALFSDSTSAEVDYSATGRMTSFDSDGFTVKYSSSTGTNASGDTYVAWNWKANGAGVSNTDGSITSTVSANPTAGFSIATLTSQSSGVGTFGHGLGVAPSMIILKPRNSANAWIVWHRTLPASQYLLLAATNGALTETTYFNSTAPSSSVVTLGTAYAGGASMVCYSFAEVPGYSRFGSYTGNGSADGPFVFCGFRPAFVMIKRTDSTGGWAIFDDTRSSFNVADDWLYANLSDSEFSDLGHGVDLLSSGVKLRHDGAAVNTNGGTYIFMAFSESPFKHALAR